MNDQLSTVLAQLAQKLGVAVNQLWNVMLAQEKESGITYLLLNLIIIALCAVGMRVVWGLYKKTRVQEAEERKNRDPYRSTDDHEGLKVLLFIIGLVCAIAIVALAYDCVEQVLHIINPAYYALQDILSAAKGK